MGADAHGRQGDPPVAVDDSCRCDLLKLGQEGQGVQMERSTCRASLECSAGRHASLWWSVMSVVECSFHANQQRCISYPLRRTRL
jgi:hypothetical protein